MSPRRVGLTRRLLGLATCLVAIALGLVASVAEARSGGPPQRVSLVTFGVGDHPFSRFGHNALLVHGNGSFDGLVYNFGTFQFDSPLLILDFLQGKLKYWLSVSDWQSSVAHYRVARRDVRVQTLLLRPEQVESIANELADNALPENRYYVYDYYLDNCSTRVRDVLDEALAGALRDGFSKPTQLSYRDFTRRMTEPAPLLYLALDFAMGPYIDRPLSRWEAMFLPPELETAVSELGSVGSVSKRGNLVEMSTVVYDSGRPSPTATVPDWSWFLSCVSSLVATALALLGRRAYSSRLARRCLALVLFGTGILFGGMGLILVGLWAGTNHEVTYRNANVLLSSPLALGLCWFALGVARARPAALQTSLALAIAIFGSALVGSLICLLGFSVQQIGQMAAWFLPFWTGVVLALLFARGAEFSLRILSANS